MKYLITERQFKLIKEENNEIRIIPYFMANENWYDLQEFINGISDPPPPYILRGDVDLRGVDVVTLGSLVGVEGSLSLNFNETIKDLGNLQYVRDILNLTVTKIESLGNLQYVGGYLFLRNSNIESLGNLQYVGRDLYLSDSEKIEDLGNLETVGGDLYLRHTPLSKTTNRKEIRDKVKVGNRIFI